MSFHKHARLAAEAALAAKAQGKFWEYADLLFKNQRALSREDLERYAQQLGLDMDRFRKDLDTHAHAAQIDRDLAEARKAGVRGTPTFVVNDQLVRGALPFAAFKNIIDEELGLRPKQRGERRGEQGGAAAGNAGGEMVSVGALPPLVIGPRQARHTVVLVLDPTEREAARLLHSVSRAVSKGHGVRAAAVFKPLKKGSVGERVALSALAVARLAGADKAWEYLKLASARAGHLDDAQLADLAKRVGVEPAKIRKAVSSGKDRRVLATHAKATAKYATSSRVLVAVDGKRSVFGGRGAARRLIDLLSK